MTVATEPINLVTSETLLQNWQGHRRLTRKIIEAFPEDKLFTFSVKGMRTFGKMTQELISMTIPVVRGVSTGKWTTFEERKPETKAEILQVWDEQTRLLEQEFPEISEARFWAVEKAFDQWEMPGIVMIQYAIDNEIHHRGEGYVYLRELGIEPPPFWDRN